MKPLLKLLITLFLLGYAGYLMAQKNVGPGLTYGTEIDRLGVVVNSNFELNENWEVSPSFTYYLPKTYDFVTSQITARLFSLEADVHYVFNVSKFRLYPLAGINFSYSSSKVRSSEPLIDDPLHSDGILDIGVNVGGGATYPFNDNITGFSELKFTISNYDRVSLYAGILFNL